MGVANVLDTARVGVLWKSRFMLLPLADNFMKRFAFVFVFVFVLVKNILRA